MICSRPFGDPAAACSHRYRPRREQHDRRRAGGSYSLEEYAASRVRQPEIELHSPLGFGKESRIFRGAGSSRARHPDQRPYRGPSADKRIYSFVVQIFSGEAESACMRKLTLLPVGRLCAGDPLAGGNCRTKAHRTGLDDRVRETRRPAFCLRKAARPSILRRCS